MRITNLRILISVICNSCPLRTIGHVIPLQSYPALLHPCRKISTLAHNGTQTGCLFSSSELLLPLVHFRR